MKQKRFWARFAALLASLFLLSAGALHAQPMELSGKAKRDFLERMQKLNSGEPLHDEPALADHMEAAKRLGLRIDGLYWSKREPRADQPDAVSKPSRSTSYFRFCNDGSIIAASSIGIPDDVSAWMTCESGKANRSQGVIREKKGVLTFTMHNLLGEVDYTVRALRSPSGASLSDGSEPALVVAMERRLVTGSNDEAPLIADYQFYPVESE